MAEDAPRIVAIRQQWCPLCNRRTNVSLEFDEPWQTSRCQACGFVHRIVEKEAAHG